MKYCAVVSSHPEHSMESQRYENMKLRDKNRWRDTNIYVIGLWKEENGGNTGEKISKWPIIEKFPEMKKSEIWEICSIKKKKKRPIIVKLLKMMNKDKVLILSKKKPRLFMQQ